MKKQKIKITESFLRRAVRESITKVLNEDYTWYGNTQPIEEIIKNAQAALQNLEGSDIDDNESSSWKVRKWLESVVEEGEYWLRENAQNTSVNGGEDW